MAIHNRPIDKATWDRVAVLAVNRAFALGVRGGLMLPITATIRDAQIVVFQFRLPALEAALRSASSPR